MLKLWHIILVKALCPSKGVDYKKDQGRIVSSHYLSSQLLYKKKWHNQDDWTQFSDERKIDLSIMHHHRLNSMNCKMEIKIFQRFQLYLTFFNRNIYKWYIVCRPKQRSPSNWWFSLRKGGRLNVLVIWSRSPWKKFRWVKNVFSIFCYCQFCRFCILEGSICCIKLWNDWKSISDKNTISSVNRNV